MKIACPRSLFRRTTALIAFAVLTIAGCSIPGDGKVTTIAPGQIPYDLSATTTLAPTTTTSSTTTTTLPFATTTSTSSTIPAEEVTLFFIAGTQVVPITQLLLSPATPPQVLSALAQGVPLGDTSAGLRSALPADFAGTVTVSRGIATVDLPPTFITDLPGAEQRLAVAQIVLSLTRRAGIGQIIFTSNERPQSVPRGRGDLTQPGGAVACDDYSNLLPSGVAC